MYATPRVIMSAMRLFTGESGCSQGYRVSTLATLEFASERGKIPRTNQT
jgi:hypothetical protein